MDTALDDHPRIMWLLNKKPPLNFFVLLNRVSEDLFHMMYNIQVLRECKSKLSFASTLQSLCINMFNLTSQRAQHIDAVQSPCLDKSSFKDSFAYYLLPTQISGALTEVFPFYSSRPWGLVKEIYALKSQQEHFAI